MEVRSFDSLEYFTVVAALERKVTADESVEQNS